MLESVWSQFGVMYVSCWSHFLSKNRRSKIVDRSSTTEEMEETEETEVTEETEEAEETEDNVRRTEE